jgi:hypothetical protein
VVIARHRPRYIHAGPETVVPNGGGQPFRPAGRDRWAIGVRLDAGLFRPYHQWTMGIDNDGRLYVLKVRLAH